MTKCSNTSYVQKYLILSEYTAILNGFQRKIILFGSRRSQWKHLLWTTQTLKCTSAKAHFHFFLVSTKKNSEKIEETSCLDVSFKNW